MRGRANAAGIAPPARWRALSHRHSLAGAYQEVMGNLHNLFGSTNAVHMRLNPRGSGYVLDHVVHGDTNADVLQVMEHDPDLMLERLRQATEQAIRQHPIADARRLMDHLKTSLRQT